ncbi:MAG: hypothetical protein HRU09_20085 [Oligoflexales bacterium]|nr:hypothetical protein [Oligoflexales bacterium]
MVLKTGSTINDGDCEVVSKWRDAVTELKNSDGIEWHVVLKVFGNYRECDIGQATITWHQYGPSTVTHQHGHSKNIEGFEGSSSFVVSPGYRKANYDDGKFLRRNSSDWEAAVKNMVDSNAIWHLITTFNEWGEGTGIEPVHNYNYYNAPGNPHDIEQPDAKLSQSTYFIDVLAVCESKDKCNMEDLDDPIAEELVFLSENNFFAGELCVGSYCLKIQNDRNLVIRKNGRVLGGAQAKYNELPLSTGHTPFRVFMQNDGNLCIQEESLKSNTGEKYFCFGPVEGSNPRLVVQGKELKVKTDSGNSETIGSMLRLASVDSDKKSIIQWQEEPTTERQKLVIFDFDDTLWMNGDGEDKEGNDNTDTVTVGPASYAISAIQEFHNRGVKIAICSKNANSNGDLKKTLQADFNDTGIFTDAFFESPAFLTGTPRESDGLHCENDHNTGKEGDYDDGKAYGAKHIIDYFGVQNPNDVVFFDDASYNETDITNSERETNAGFRMEEIGFICVDKREDSVDTENGGGVTRDRAELALGMLGFSGFPTLNNSCDDEVISVEGSTLLVGGKLEENQYIVNGQYRLYMQDDGNLVKQMKNQGDGWSTLDKTGAKGSGTSVAFMDGRLRFFKGGQIIGKSMEKDEDAQGVVLNENGALP